MDCNNCFYSTSYACMQKVKVKQHEVSSMSAMPTLNYAHFPCVKVGCMSCAFNIMSAYINLMNASYGSCINSDMNVAIHRAKTVSPPKVRKDTRVSKPKVTPDKAKTKYKSKVDEPIEHVEVVHVAKSVKISKPLGPKQVWVPKKK